MSTLITAVSRHLIKFSKGSKITLLAFEIVIHVQRGDWLAGLILRPVFARLPERSGFDIEKK
jgi:hypothetical protein